MVLLQGGKSTVCPMLQLWGKGTSYQTVDSPAQMVLGVGDSQA